MIPQDLKKRAARIWKAVKIGKVLSDLGYEVDPYDESNQQFSCDLHGSEDHDPSAHLYYDQNAWHCFGCGKRRDAVQTVMDKKKKGFKEALEFIEEKYKIAAPKAPTELIIPLNGADKEFADVRKDVEGILLYLSTNRYFDMEQAVHFWNKYDLLCSSEFRKTYPEEVLKNFLVKVKNEAISSVNDS